MFVLIPRLMKMTENKSLILQKLWVQALARVAHSSEKPLPRVQCDMSVLFLS